MRRINRATSAATGESAHAAEGSRGVGWGWVLSMDPLFTPPVTPPPKKNREGRGGEGRGGDAVSNPSQSTDRTPALERYEWT